MDMSIPEGYPAELDQQAVADFLEIDANFVVRGNLNRYEDADGRTMIPVWGIATTPMRICWCPDDNAVYYAMQSHLFPVLQC